MRRPRRYNPLTIALWSNAIALALIAVALWSRGGTPDLLSSAMAQNNPPVGGAAGAFIVPGQFSTNTYGCYILDADAQTLAAYQYYPADKQLRLVAARNVRHDRRLQSFNTAPDPDEIRRMNDRQQQDDADNAAAAPRKPAGAAGATTGPAEPTTRPDEHNE